MSAEITIPPALHQYSAIVKWLSSTFKGCDDLNINTTVHEQLDYLLQLYRHSSDPTCKFISDLVGLNQIWNFRVIALSNTEYPDYWNPLTETFLVFKQRSTDKFIKTLNSSVPIIETELLMNFFFKLKDSVKTEAVN